MHIYEPAYVWWCVFFSKSQFIEIIYNEYMYSQSNPILMKHSLCFKTKSFLNCPRICSYATFGVKTYTAVPDNILRWGQCVELSCVSGIPRSSACCLCWNSHRRAASRPWWSRWVFCIGRVLWWHVSTCCFAVMSAVSMLFNLNRRCKNIFTFVPFIFCDRVGFWLTEVHLKNCHSTSPLVAIWVDQCFSYTALNVLSHFNFPVVRCQSRFC